MGFKKNNFAAFSLMILLFFGFVDDAARAQSGDQLKLDPAKISWTDLTFHAKNFWVEVTTEVQLRPLAASGLDAVLPASPRGDPIKPLMSEVAEMTIQTTIDPSFRSPVSLYSRVWLDPTNASILGRVMLRRGEDDFKKIYRFTDRGVFRHQLEPKDKQEAALDPEKWTAIKDSFYPYDLTRLQCSGVTEPSILIYIVNAAIISKMNDPLSLCAFGKRQLHRVTVQRGGNYPVKVSFIEKRQQGKIRKGERGSAIKIAVNAKPMESDLSEVENFSFLGLHQDISIFIDPTTQLPLQVSGIITGLGKAELNLNEIKWAPQSD